MFMYNVNVRILMIGLALLFLTNFNSHGQKSGITLVFKETELLQVLDRIEQETGCFFLFNEKLINTKQKISIEVTNGEINNILHLLLDKLEIKFSVIDDKIILAPESLFARLNLSTLEGFIYDENGNSMPGVNVQVEGTAVGAISDEKGRFSIVVNNLNSVLLFSFVGYKPQRVNVEGKTSINVAMELDVSNLEEVVVLGYGTIKKSDLTGVVALNEQTYKSQPVSRVDDILQGRSAGVNVTNVSGAPGGTTSIRIRGANSINGNNDPLYVIDGFVGGSMADVNPMDIGTVQILKDASSTAIYGSRGANGVVLITTKKGTEGDPKLTVSSRYYNSNPIKLWPLLKAGEFALICNERADIIGYTRPFSEEQVNYFLNTDGTDWQDLIFRQAGGEEIQLDYSGGSHLINFFISGNFLNQDGIIINSKFKRYSLRTNLEAKLSDRLGSSLKINFSRRENNNTSGNYTTSSAIAGAAAWAPTTPAYDQSGKLTVYDPVSSTKANPVELAMNDDINESNTFITNINFIYDIIQGLSFNTGFGINYGNSQSKRFNLRSLTKAPSASKSINESIFLQNTNVLTYTVADDNNDLTITGVAEFQFQQNDFFSATSNNLLFPFLEYYNLNLAKTYTLTNYFRKSTIGSYIARVNYSLLNKYLITLSVRNDRSSKFRGVNQKGIFPSIGMGWRISGENFMMDLPFISNLKIRTSWGRTGSQGINEYGTVTAYNTSVSEASVSWHNGTITPGINIGNPGNENLKWETTTQTNLGLDLGLFKNRISLEIDYFYKITDDLLLQEPLPGYVGGGSIFRNIGSIRNSGYEFNLDAMVVNRKDFSLNFNLNVSLLQNEVLDLGRKPYILQWGGAGAGMLTAPEMILKPGYSISTFYGFKSLGIWQLEDAELASEYNQQPGDYRYEDVNGDYAFTGEDFQIIGSGIPRKVIGLNSTITYKNFTLNFFLQSMLDYDKWNFAYAQIMIAPADAREYTHRDILNRWSPDNTSSRIAAFSKTNVPRIQSSEYIESGDYVRLKNASLQYALPLKMKRGNLSALFSAQNLFTITGYRGLDPETYSNVGFGDLRGGDGGAYPNARTWTFGLSLTY